MSIGEYLRLARLTNNCPNCDSETIGTEEETGIYHGFLKVEDTTYERGCACGFTVTLSSGMKQNEAKAHIKSGLEDFKQFMESTT